MLPIHEKGKNMKTRIVALCLMLGIVGVGDAAAGALKTHGIFSSNMVIQRDKPITIWGWAETGRKVTVRFGETKAEAMASGEAGRWEVTFPARQADAAGLKLTVASGDDTIELENILIGDVWVMNGQSNMAFGLGKTYRADLETATAHLPLFRRVGIAPNESENLETDIPADKVNGWTVCTPETAGGFSSIGYTFGSRLQRALQVPVGIIDNARGGASIESLVPRHKFEDHPLAAKYLKWVEKRRTEFDWDVAF
jgi:sialate O-acetylesterase